MQNKKIRDVQDLSHGTLYYDKAEKMRKLQETTVINWGQKSRENDALEAKQTNNKTERKYFHWKKIRLIL